VAPMVRAIFCDPWPMDCITAFLNAIMRRLYSCPGAAEYLMSLANAVVEACPSRVRAEYLHQMWDTCLRWVRGLRLALGLRGIVCKFVGPLRD
jgi:hypothetical protein